MTDNTAPQKVLVTGANGLLGRATVDCAQSQGHEVYALVRTDPEDLIPGVHYISMDLADFETARLPSRVDAVIHLAQESGFRCFPEHAKRVFSVNTCSTQALLDYAVEAHARGFVFTSTGGLYAPKDRPRKEDDAITAGDGPLAHYFATKWSSELLISTYSRFISSITVFRPFFIFGPGQQEQMLIPRMLQRILADEPVQLAKGSGPTLNPIPVSVAARYVERSLGKPSGYRVLNLAGSEEISLNSICQILAENLKRAVKISTNDSVADNLCGDISRLKIDLGNVVQSYPLREYLEEVAKSRFSRDH